MASAEWSGDFQLLSLADHRKLMRLTEEDRDPSVEEIHERLRRGFRVSTAKLTIDRCEPEGLLPRMPVDPFQLTETLPVLRRVVSDAIQYDVFDLCRRDYPGFALLLEYNTVDVAQYENMFGTWPETVRDGIRAGSTWVEALGGHGMFTRSSTLRFCDMDFALSTWCDFKRFYMKKASGQGATLEFDGTARVVYCVEATLIADLKRQVGKQIRLQLKVWTATYGPNGQWYPAAGARDCFGDDYDAMVAATTMKLAAMYPYMSDSPLPVPQLPADHEALDAFTGDDLAMLHFERAMLSESFYDDGL